MQSEALVEGEPDQVSRAVEIEKDRSFNHITTRNLPVQLTLTASTWPWSEATELWIEVTVLCNAASWLSWLDKTLPTSSAPALKVETGRG